MLNGVAERAAESCIGRRVPRRDCRSNTRSGLEQASTDERRQRLLCGVRIDLQLLAERSDRWKAIARTQLSGDDCFRDSEHDLIVQRATRTNRDAER